MEAITKLFEDPITMAPICCPCILFDQLYECATLMRLLQKQASCPFTRKPFTITNIAEAPRVVREACALVNTSNAAETRYLNSMYASYLYAIGDLKRAADRGYVRAMVDLAALMNSESRAWAKKLAQLVPANGSQILGQVLMAEGSHQQAHKAFLTNWNDPGWNLKAETAYCIACNYYILGDIRQTNKWARRSDQLKERCSTKLLLAQNMTRNKPVTRAHWDEIISLLDGVLSMYDLVNDPMMIYCNAEFIQAFAMAERKGRFSSSKKAKKIGLERMRHLAFAKCFYPAESYLKYGCYGFYHERVPFPLLWLSDPETGDLQSF